MVAGGVWVHSNWFGPRGCSLWSPPGAERVVCARWCPTLPHPGGCSTIGAVRLSFRVRDGSGRFPVAVTTETTTWAVRQCSCDSVIRLPANTHTRMRMLCVWLVVGLGVDRIVDALRMLTRAHPWASHARCVCGVWGCCCLCWPISTSQLKTVAGLPLLAYQPSSLLGAYQEGQVLLVETLS